MKKFLFYIVVLGALAHGALSVATPALAGSGLRIEAALSAAGV